MVEVIMPPTMEAAMGFITSEPTPVSHRIGTRLANTAVTVISLGRSRRTAPSIAASSMLLNALQGRTLDLEADRRLDPCEFHV